jgi:hypothetical protein
MSWRSRVQKSARKPTISYQEPAAVALDDAFDDRQSDTAALESRAVQT